jgi:hypothetical protein
MDVNLLYAIGGIRIWVPEAETVDARAFIAASRRQPSSLEPLPVPEATARTLASLLLALVTGFVMPLRPRRPDRLGDGPMADEPKTAPRNLA